MTRIIFTIMLAALAAGCSGPTSQLTSCQQEKEQLLAAIRTQRDSNRALNEQVASLESRLDQAEKQVALGPSGTRVSTRVSEPSGTKQPAAAAPKSESLPWRSPPATNEKRSAVPSKPSDSLQSLARRDKRWHYDPASAAARVDLPLAFENDGATLSGEDKRQLDDLARQLKSDDARELRVMITGSAAGRVSTASGDRENRFDSARQLGTARAQAVADYLDRHGIAQERLAVTGTGTRSATSTSSAVQVFLMDADAPVVGWNTPSSSPARR